MVIEENMIYDTDSYKGTHFLGYPQGSEYVYSYLESRGGKYDEIVMCGTNRLIKLLNEMPLITPEIVEEADAFWKTHVGVFNKEGWMRIATLHGGRLPVTIRALPEGTVAKPGVPLVTIINNDPELYWLTSWMETWLLRNTWYQITVASRIRYMKRKIKKYFTETSDNYDSLPFALLDFSSRGVTSLEASQTGGYAYLLFFMGSDNVPAVRYTNDLYKYNSKQALMSGFSVPATEHSIMCSFGEDNEEDSFHYLLDRMGFEGGILSIVSDTWNVFRAADRWNGELAEKAKRKKVTVVFRPDSGDISHVLPILLEKLALAFGYKINSKGYRVLDGVKILWGDGIDEETCTLPFEIAKNLGYSADSILTGSGGGLMTKDMTRDICKFAVKASAIRVNGEWREISKNPVTDTGKRSKKGMFFVLDDLTVVNQDLSKPEIEPDNNILELIYSYENGSLFLKPIGTGSYDRAVENANFGL